jgi:hypothetical protein
MKMKEERYVSIVKIGKSYAYLEKGPHFFI